MPPGRSNGSSSRNESARRTASAGDRCEAGRRRAGTAGRRVSPGSRAPRGLAANVSGGCHRHRDAPGMVAGHEVVVADRPQPGLGGRALGGRGRAAGVEAAAARRLAPARVARPRPAPGAASTRPRRRSARRGSTPAARWCRGGPGRGTAPSLGPTSHILPRYITATRSLMLFTTARSWAMKIRVNPSRALRSSSRLSTWACTLTSSADTGSSQMISVGSSTSARAIEMRWH